MRFDRQILPLIKINFRLEKISNPIGESKPGIISSIDVFDSKFIQDRLLRITCQSYLNLLKIWSDHINGLGYFDGIVFIDHNIYCVDDFRLIPG